MIEGWVMKTENYRVGNFSKFCDGYLAEIYKKNDNAFVFHRNVFCDTNSEKEALQNNADKELECFCEEEEWGWL